jgi:exonuclease III
MNLTDIYRRFHPETKEYTFSSALHDTFSKIDHIIGQKTGLNRYKKTEEKQEKAHIHMDVEQRFTQ